MDLMSQFDLGYEGFAKANQETLEALSKALTAGNGVDAGSFTGGRALTPESLDAVLVSVLHTTDEARLFQKLKKNPVKSVVHQWNYRNEVGADDGGWVAEGGSSASADQTIARKYTTAKYLQTKRTVTLQAATTNMLEDAIGIEQEAGALWLIRNVEKGLIYGNSSMNTYEPDGLNSQIPAGGIIDLRGKDATSAEFEQAMNDAARQIRNYYGKATHMFSSTMVMEDVQVLLRDRIRFAAGNTQGSSVFKDYPTPFGTFELVDDVFIREGDVPRTSSLAGIPGGTTPIAGSGATSPTDATAKFTAADAGVYNYKIVPVNQYGPGAAVEMQATAVVAGDAVWLPITTYPVPAATSYKVFRSKVGGVASSEVREAFTVSHAQVVADGNKVIDRNFFLPGCSDVFILNMNPSYNAIEWVQFLPLMKFDLYPTDAAVYPFLMLLFGSLALKKPEHHIRVKNVAPSTLGWF
jgi:hypothetical protein